MQININGSGVIWVVATDAEGPIQRNSSFVNVVVFAMCMFCTELPFFNMIRRIKRWAQGNQYNYIKKTWYDTGKLRIAYDKMMDVTCAGVVNVSVENYQHTCVTNPTRSINNIHPTAVSPLCNSLYPQWQFENLSSYLQFVALKYQLVPPRPIFMD